MPVIRPLPIKTKNRGIIARIFIWIFSIRKWEVQQEWRHTLPAPYNEEVVIPENYVFNGASIPRPFWILLSPVGLLLIPSLVHDYAYSHGKLIILTKDGKKVDYKAGAGRLFWDALFRRVALEVNGFAFINNIAWLGLVLFGWIAWLSNAKNRRQATGPQSS